MILPPNYLLPGCIPSTSLTTNCSITFAQVLKITPITDAGNLKAFATVKVGPWTIHGVRIVQQPGQRPWVALPQTEGKPGHDGKRRWFSVIEAEDRELRAVIEQAVLAAWGGL